MNRVNWRIYRLAYYGKIWMPDRMYLKLKYRLLMNRKLHLHNPKMFTEKIQWIKLNYHNPIYTTMADKYAVRDYVRNIIGEEYLIPLIGVYEKWDDINFTDLPDSFVIKCNHDSGSVQICNNKKTWDSDLAKQIITNSLRHNYYPYSREWQYKNIKPCIIIEELLVEKSLNEKQGLLGLLDYKFFCFNGEPKFLYVSYNYLKNGQKHTQLINLDLDWKKTEFRRSDEPELEFEIKKPKQFDKMIELAKLLSKNVPFVRIDFYNPDNRIYFSEITFCPTGGFIPFDPPIYDRIYGDMLELPKKMR